MPILSFDSIDQVPDVLRQYAKVTENLGSTAVIVDVTASAKLEEFREANIRFTKERDNAIAEVEDLRKKAKGFDSFIADMAKQLSERENKLRAEVAQLQAERDAYKASCQEWLAIADEAASDVDLLVDFILSITSIEEVEAQHEAYGKVLDILSVG